MTTSTISGNRALDKVGAIDSHGTSTITSSTIVKNTGDTASFAGLHRAAGTVTLTNSIVAAASDRPGVKVAAADADGLADVIVTPATGDGPAIAFDARDGSRIDQARIVSQIISRRFRPESYHAKNLASR
ncbi:MAG: hypothetical protein O3A00_18440 [Planctomycetota bacterium]|nr:hypothetical protein [Planctomycetota bacterium]